jgi:hypothetical protein
MYYSGTSAEVGMEYPTGELYGQTLTVTFQMNRQSETPPVVDVVLIGGDCRLTVLGSFSAGTPVTVDVMLGQAVAFRAGTSGSYYASYLGTINVGEFLGYTDTYPSMSNHDVYV